MIYGPPVAPTSDLPDDTELSVAALVTAQRAWQPSEDQVRSALRKKPFSSPPPPPHPPPGYGKLVAVGFDHSHTDVFIFHTAVEASFSLMSFTGYDHAAAVVMTPPPPPPHQISFYFQQSSPTTAIITLHQDYNINMTLARWGRNSLSFIKRHLKTENVAF